MHVTLSIGISVYPDDGEDADSLIHRADTAMFHAKERGPNGYAFFTPVMTTRPGERHTLESGAHRSPAPPPSRALARKAG
jgi:predicted signal transduction protein with EAL and GGDEF domain